MSNMPLGWLSPLGGLYDCEEYEHLSLARDIVESYLYNRDNNRYDYDTILLERGWAHITYSCTMNCYIVDWDNFLTSYQKNYLKPFFEDETININRTTRLLFEEELER